MYKYETIFIMKNDITEEQKNMIISTVKNYLYEKGKITEEQDLGQKKLAYECKTYTEGKYYLIDFDANPEAIAELEQMYRITEEILKSIVVRKDY
ncbi:MAG: 30S ribosomal protein S6 [Clostridia bacterium]|nr:30S ribosomal protein S6 [Clostridia bacterium]